APNSASTLSTATGSPCTIFCSGRRWYTGLAMLNTPRCLITRFPAIATGTAASAAAASDSSYQAEDQRRHDVTGPAPGSATRRDPTIQQARRRSGPGPRPGTPPRPDDPAGPQRAREEKRDDTDDLDERVADDRPG